MPHSWPIDLRLSALALPLLMLVADAAPAQIATSNCTSGGTGPHDVVIADLDGVNGLDAIVSYEYSNTVVSYLDNGSGVLVQSQVRTFPGAAPRGLVAQDFDGLGTVDIAVACPGDGTVRVLYGAGNGNWTSTVVINTGGTPVDVAAANLPAGSGPPNLIVADQGGFFTSGRVLVLQNGARTTLGAESFGAPSVLVSGGTYVSLAGGDVYGGSGTDLVVADSSPAPVGGILVFDSATGAQVAGSPFLSGTPVNHVSLYRMNGDAKLDILWTAASFIGGAGLGVLETPSFTSFTLGSSSTIDAVGGVFEGDSDLLPDVMYVTATGSLRRLRNYHGSGVVDGDDFLASGAFGLAAGQVSLIGSAGNPGCQTDEVVVARKGQDQVCTYRINVVASVSAVSGSGCPGSPIVAGTAGGGATIGNSNFAVDCSGASTSSFAVLFLQLNLPHGSAPTLYPLSGCNHLLDVTQPFIDVPSFYSVSQGGAQVAIQIPNLPVLLCQEVIAQWALFDGTGPISGISVSNALRIRIGEI